MESHTDFSILDEFQKIIGLSNLKEISLLYKEKFYNDIRTNLRLDWSKTPTLKWSIENHSEWILSFLNIICKSIFQPNYLCKIKEKVYSGDISVNDLPPLFDNLKESSGEIIPTMKAGVLNIVSCKETSKYLLDHGNQLFLNPLM